MIQLCYFYYSYYLLADGLPWAWGKGNNGQLGISEKGDKERVPRLVELCRRGVTRAGMLGHSQVEYVVCHFEFSSQRKAESCLRYRDESCLPYSHCPSTIRGKLTVEKV